MCAQEAASQTALLVSHKGMRCGVQQYGRGLFRMLRRAERRPDPPFVWRYLECSNLDTLLVEAGRLRPAATLFNHHPATLGWASAGGWGDALGTTFAIFHEIYQEVADTAVAAPMDYFLGPDPTLLARNAAVLPVPRFTAPRRRSTVAPPEVFTIGSFGFATPGKGFERLCRLVNEQFETARVRINIPAHDHRGISSESDILHVVERCLAEVTRPGIELEFTHSFLTPPQIVDFLKENTLNAFLYEIPEARGLSSCIDFALASGRPVAVSRSSMFRHLHDANPSVCVEDRTLRAIAESGPAPLQRHRRDWAPARAEPQWTSTLLEAIARKTARA